MLMAKSIEKHYNKYVKENRKMEELIKILNSIKPGIDYANNDSLVEDGVLDSLAIVSLVAAIDKTFDVQIRATDLVPKNFNSANSIYELIQRLEEE